VVNVLDMYDYLNKRRLERKELKPKVKIVKKKPLVALFQTKVGRINNVILI